MKTVGRKGIRPDVGEDETTTGEIELLFVCIRP